MKQKIYTIVAAALVTSVAILIDLGTGKIDAGSSVQSLTTDSSGKITAHQRDGTSQSVISGGGGLIDNGILTIKETDVNLDPANDINLIIEDDIPTIQFLATDSGESQILFGDSASSNATGRLSYRHDLDELRFVAEDITIGKANDTNGWELSVRTDANCGIGNVCTGTFTPTISSEVNVSSIPTTGWSFQRVGNVVTIFNEGAMIPTTVAAISFVMTLPIDFDTNPGTVGRVGGTASPMDSANDGNMGCRPNNNTTTLKWQGGTTLSGAQAWSFHCSYRIN